jgi:hypothetical protein
LSAPKTPWWKPSRSGKERERARAEFRETLDDAEASLTRGEGTEITRESMRELTDGIMERTGVRIAAEQKAAR